MAELTLPLELTAPAIQRLARKGLGAPLSAAECAWLCEIVLFHVDTVLEQRRVPRVGPPVRPPAPPR